MSSRKAEIVGVAKRYAAAAFELACQDKLLNKVTSDLAGLDSLSKKNLTLQRFICDPTLPLEDKSDGVTIISQALGLSPLTRRFLGVVTINRRLPILSIILTEFLSRVAEYRGEVKAEVVSAQVLSLDQQNALQKALEAITAKEKVVLNIRIDPSLLGGAIIRVGSRIVDNSLRTKLERMRYAMKGVG